GQKQTKNASPEARRFVSAALGPKGLCPSGLPTLAAVRLGGWGLRSLRSLRSQPQSQRLGRSTASRVRASPRHPHPVPTAYGLRAAASGAALDPVPLGTRA